MEKSFRQILSEQLDTAANSAPVTESANPASLQETVYQFNFTWNAPNSNLKPRAKYARPEAKVPAAAEVPKATPPPPKKEEPAIPLSQLSDSDQFLVQRLIRYGGTELSSGLSSSRLKKVYRRLAKQLHPDVSPGTAMKFMEVQKAYQTLAGTLASALACDSGSASGSANRRPSAA